MPVFIHTFGVNMLIPTPRVRHLARRIASASCLGVLVLTGTRAAAEVAPKAQTVCYQFTHDVALGATGVQDYLTLDPSAHRLYVSHYDKVDVIDTRSDTLLGTIGPFHDSHGIAIVDRLGKGYADSGQDGVVKVFSLSDLRIQKEIPVSPDADGMVYDQKTGLVLLVAGDSKELMAINPVKDQVVETIALPGKPEFLTTDGDGDAFVNLADVAKIAKVNLRKGRVEATWSLLGCKDPHGIAYDSRTRRLFSGCANQRLIVVDASNGRNLANLPIGAFSDSVAVDRRRGLVFSANGTGTLTVIGEHPGDRYTVVSTIPTFFGARNMAVDPETGDLFLAHETMKIESPLSDLLNLRFGWSGVDVAVLQPQS